MAEITTARKIWIDTQSAARPVLAAGLTGTPEPIEPAPLLTPAVYIEASRGNEVAAASANLSDPTVSLIAMLPSPDGPPVTLGLLFSRVRDVTISYQNGGRSFHGRWATEYEAARAGGDLFGKRIELTGYSGHF
jgi:hypothetical protein